MEGKKANGEIEMHGINFRHRTRTLQRDLIKDALRFISEVEWSPSSARTCPPLLDYIHPSTSASCSLFIRPNKPTKFAHPCSNVNWTFPGASFTANLSAKLFYRVSLPVITRSGNFSLPRSRNIFPESILYKRMVRSKSWECCCPLLT